MNSYSLPNLAFLFVVYQLGLGLVPAQILPPIDAVHFITNRYWTNIIRTNINLGAKPGELLWSLTLSNPITSAPAVADDGTIYFGSGFELMALNGTTGTIKWGFEAGGTVGGSPSIGPDKTIYISCGMPDWSSFLGFLCKVEPTSGAEVWNVPLSQGGAYYASPARDAFGRVFLNEMGMVHAYDERTGRELWNRSIFLALSVPAIGTNNLVYLAGIEGVSQATNLYEVPSTLYALDAASGSNRWTYELDGFAASSPSIGADGKVIVASYMSQNGSGRVSAIDGATGQKIWEFRAGAYMWITPVIGTNGWVYLGSMTKKIYAIDGQNGAKKWEFTTKSEVKTSMAVGADGTVYAADDDALYALNGVTGALMWTYTNNGASTSITIAPNGTLLFADKKLLCAVKANSSQGAAPSPWPMQSQNSFHTGRGWSAPATLSLTKSLSPPGADQPMLQGAAGRRYQVGIATNLSPPVAWTTLILTNRYGSMALPSAPSSQQRFYRLERLGSN
jgi:outer membrane protein assembly factor BamB